MSEPNQAPRAVPDAVKPPPGNPRFPLIDGLRAIAAISVLVTHTGFISGFNGTGFLGELTARMDAGVALFFVISGFLLHRPFVAARLNGRELPRVRRYARRRALRILPAYWLALTVLAIWPGLYGVFTGDWWVYYGLVQNLKIEWLLGGIGPAWSLAVEMQFYLLLPLYAWLAHRLMSGVAPDRQVRVELALLAVLASLSLTVRMIAFWDGLPNVESTTIVGTFTWFALGMSAAVISARWHHEPAEVRPRVVRAIASHPSASWGLSLALFVLVSQIGMPTMNLAGYTASDWFFGHLLYGAVALTLSAPAMLGGDRPSALPARFLGWRPVAWLGLVSYGIFLWHHPFTVELLGVQNWTSHGSFLVFTAVVFAASVVCATLSYYLVERPLLRFKEPRSAAPPSGSSSAARSSA